MTQSRQDQWADWLLHRRHGDNPERLKAVFADLYPIRDHLLEGAEVSEGQVLLDVGAGDGLIAFGALDRVGSQGKVIFSDISQDLLDHSCGLAEQMGVRERCTFIRASADDLSMLAEASVDVVTTRSVLIYVDDKLRAFREFFRVLKSKGRLASFEPINRFGYDFYQHSVNEYWGRDMTPIKELMAKVQAVYTRYQDPHNDAMMNFDERDLLTLAEAAGFQHIHLEYHAHVSPRQGSDWDSAYRTSGNPKLPTLEDALSEALTPSEMEVYVSYLRPLVEKGGGVVRRASAYLWAVKH